MPLCSVLEPSLMKQFFQEGIHNTNQQYVNYYSMLILDHTLALGSQPLRAWV